jgi:S1 RNA binding domain protein
MQVENGAILEGKVTGITKFGAFVDLGEGVTGMVHISEVAPTYVSDIKDHLKENDTVKVKVMNVGEDGKISLSIKKAIEPQHKAPRERVQPRTDWIKERPQPTSFEDMMSRFKQSSDEKFSELKRKSGETKRPRRGQK